MCAFIIAVSVILQITAAILALRLIRVTEKRAAWVLISLCLFLMAGRRAFALWMILLGQLSNHVHLNEVLGLVISVCMLIGVACIKPYFLAIKYSEDRARVSEDKYRAVFEGTGTAMVVIDEDATISLVNNEFLRLAGYSREEVEGKLKWTSFVLPEDLPKMREYQVARLKDPTSVPKQYDFRCRNRAGEALQMHISVDLMPGARQTIASLIDVTEQRRAEEAVHESERRYREVVEGATELIYTTDLDGNYKYANQACLDLTGYAMAQLKSMNYRDLVRSDYKRRLEVHFMRQYLKKGTSHLFEFPFKDSRGQYLWFAQNSHPVVEEGKVVGFRIIARNITDRKKIEEHQQRLLEGLHAVVRMADELIMCPDEDAVYRRAVELAREQLGVERCAIFLTDGDKACGTYGTDMKGATTDEHEHVFPTAAEWREWFCSQMGTEQHWVVAKMPLREWDGTDTQELHEGWIAHTPIAQTATHPLAFFVNDTAISGAPLDEAQQEVLSVYCTLLANIIERRRIEDRLRLTQFSTDHTGDAAFWMGPDAHFVYVNESACTLLEYTRNELLSMTVHDIDPGFPQELWEKHWEDIKSRKYAVMESVHRAKDGREVPVEITANFIVFGGKEYNCAFVRDISSRKEAETALRRSERRYRELYESLRDGWAAADKGGKLVEFNSVFKEMLGYSDEELYEMTYVDLTPEKWHKVEDQVMREQVAVRGYSDVYEKEYARKDGSLVPVELRTYLTRDIDGKPSGNWATMRDISERKEANRREADLQSRLARARRMESLGLLAGGVAHDLNNILGPIVAYPDLIIEQLPPGSPIRADVRDIQEAAKRAAAVIQDLLALARRGTYDTESVHWHDVVGQYLKSVGFRELKSRWPGVSIKTCLGNDVPHVKGSTPHLSQVLMNLVINAFEVLSSGGVVTISTTQEHVDKIISGYEPIDPGDYTVLRVADTGPGIDPADQEHIFEPFFTKKKLGRSGSGLGLSVVYGIIKDLNGFIDICSMLGKGTEFALYLPATDGGEEKREEYVRDHRGNETILVVDDLPSQRELAARLLESFGYIVIQTENGHEALDILRARPVDLVVLDMIMEEGFDGLDTYREMIRIRPGQRCVIASGFSESERVKEAQLIGAGEFVQKPYTRQNMGRAVREELDKTPDAET